MMNLIEKLYALLAAYNIWIWHYPYAPSHRFVYWYGHDVRTNENDHFFETLEEMVEEAYSHIDPLARKLVEPKDPQL